MVLAATERRLGLADKLAAVICGPSDPDRVTHGLADILRARIFAMAAVMRIATTSTGCALTLPSSWPAAPLPGSGLDLLLPADLLAGREPGGPAHVIRLGEVLVDLVPANCRRMQFHIVGRP